MSQPAVPDDTPFVCFRSGDEYSPANPFGRFELSVRRDDTARLEHHRMSGSRVWEAEIDAVVWPRLVAALADGGFPDVEVPPIPVGSTLRELTVVGVEPVGELVVDWYAPEKGAGRRVPHPRLPGRADQRRSCPCHS